MQQPPTLQGVWSSRWSRGDWASSEPVQIRPQALMQQTRLEMTSRLPPCEFYHAYPTVRLRRHRDDTVLFSRLTRRARERCAQVLRPPGTTERRRVAGLHSVPAATDRGGHLYRRPLDPMPETMDGQLPLPVPTACPVTLEALLEVGLAAEEPRLQAYPQQTDLSSAKAYLADWIDLPTRSHVLYQVPLIVTCPSLVSAQQASTSSIQTDARTGSD